MKQLLIALVLALVSQSAMADMPKGETKRVCVDQKDKAGQTVVDPKTNQPRQTCKIVRRHQKLEGQEVPVKK